MIDLTALKAELLNDPTGRGYAAPIAAGSFSQVADLLNEVQGGITVYRGVIPAHEVIGATVPADWAGLTADEKLRYQTLIGAGEVDVRQDNVRSAFLAMFAGGTATRTALTALASRQGSRAEQLWGAGAVVTGQTCVLAWRDY